MTLLFSGVKQLAVSLYHICSSFLPGTLPQLHHREVKPKPSMMVSWIEKWEFQASRVARLHRTGYWRAGNNAEAVAPEICMGVSWVPLAESTRPHISQGEIPWGLEESLLQAWELTDSRSCTLLGDIRIPVQPEWRHFCTPWALRLSVEMPKFNTL